MTINILLPVLNEENRLGKGLDRLLPFMNNHFAGRYMLTIVDNGSTDRTEAISKSYVSKSNLVKYIKLDKRGVGVAFRSGCATNEADIIGYMDIDLSTNIEHLLEVDRIFHDAEVAVVNGSRLSNGSRVFNRKWYRSITSYGLKYILKIVFNMKIDDAICGFKFFRKEIANQLIKQASDIPGWFFCIELLIRAEKDGLKIREIPVEWSDDYSSKVKVFSLIIEYIKQIIRLSIRIQCGREKKE